MNDIFVSWAEPDERAVNLLVDRLMAAGLPVNEYSRKIRAGEDIRRWVSDAIEDARIVIVCLSVAGLRHSDWLRDESGLATGRLDRTRGRLDRLVPIRIGDVPDELLPAGLRSDRLVFRQWDPVPSEADLECMVEDLTTALGLRAPLVVPAALYAMTRTESDELAGLAEESAEARARLTALCQGAGMTEPPGVWDQLQERYGATSEDFAPYRDGGRLVEVIQTVLHVINGERVPEHAPLYLRWYSRADLRRDQKERDRWRKGHSVLVVDSVSTLHPAVADDLQRTPNSLDPSRSAVICLPPYSRHTGRLEPMIRSSIEHHSRLTDAFIDWQQEYDLPNAFDIPSETSLRRWLRQFLSVVDDEKRPNHGRREKMTGGRRSAPLPLMGGSPGTYR